MRTKMVGIGGNRPKLAELNPHTPITVHPGATLVAAELAQYKVIVMTDATLAEELAVSDATHANGTQCVNGFSSRFCFHGPLKPSIETPLHGSIAQPHFLLGTSAWAPCPCQRSAATAATSAASDYDATCHC
jgi:hypothetical protein